VSRKARRQPKYEIVSNETNIYQLNKKKPTKVNIIPRNKHQEDYLVSLIDPKIDIVFAIGPAGCGKTIMATQKAIKDFQEGRIEKIVITRPNVAVDDRDIGYLPGDILKKMTPWLKPILDVFEEYYSPKEILALMEENIIEACPIAFLRGRTFKNSIVLVDEAQGTTPNSMMAILTRIGEGSKMIVTGDLDQTDHHGPNGLSDFIGRFNNNSNRISVIRFNDKDVERHPVVKDVLRIYETDK